MDLEKERGITIKAHTVRLLYTRARRAGVHAQPHRHARPRRLLLRGLALAGRLRGRHPDRGRRPGGRGPDPGQLLPGARRAASRSSRSSTRSTCPPPTSEGTREPDHRDARPRRRRGPGDLGQARHRRARGAGGDRRAHAAAQGRRRRRRSRPSSSTPSTTPTRAWSSTSASSTARVRAGQRDPVHVQRQGLRGPAGRRVRARHAAGRGARGGPGRLPHRVDQAGAPTPRWARPSPTRLRPTAEPCPGYRDAKPMVFAGLYPIEDTDYEGPARRAREAAPERLRLQLRAGDLARARLRLPLRLPRHAAPGDRAGAARAGVQPLADRHRAPACGTG